LTVFQSRDATAAFIRMLRHRFTAVHNQAIVVPKPDNAQRYRKGAIAHYHFSS
jgi:hypothetical protein